jgi:hypothetical protein
MFLIHDNRHTVISGTASVTLASLIPLTGNTFATTAQTEKNACSLSKRSMVAVQNQQDQNAKLPTIKTDRADLAVDRRVLVN